MVNNPRTFIESVDFEPLVLSAEEGVEDEAALNLDKLPAGVVSGTTLIDFSAVPDQEVRAGVSLSMLFASRVATKKTNQIQDADEDDWLAHYTNSLGDLGFALAGSAVVKSKFKKTGLRVHKAIIPFLTVAFGGAAVGPIILAALTNLQDMNAGSPWITLFDNQSKRFTTRELHFAAVSSTAADTSIRYAVARLNVALNETSVLFFRLTDASADFESVTTTMSANNSLLAMNEPTLRERLGNLSTSFIKDAEI
jgi:hypothetical protein